MVYWSVGPDFQFKLFFQQPDAAAFVQQKKVKDSDNHKMMQIELHGNPSLFVCTHDSDQYRHITFLNKDDAEKWLQLNDSGAMDVHKVVPGEVI